MSTCHFEQIKRLKKVEGQIKGIIRMIENERYCIDILTQTKAAGAALKKVEQNILEHHIKGCVKSSILNQKEEDVQQKIDEIMMLIQKLS